MDKSDYWKNRKAKKRGQGAKPNVVVNYHTPAEWQAIKRGEKILKELTNV